MTVCALDSKLTGVCLTGLIAVESHNSDRGRRPEGGLPGVFFASPDWDRNDCREKSLPEMVDRGPIPISAVSTA